MNVIFIIGIFIAFFQFVLLLNKRSKSLPDVLLAMWMLGIGIHLLSSNFYHLGYWEKYPHLIGITAPLPLIYGPLLYLYVSHSLKNETRLSKFDYLHFIPIVFSYIYLSRFYFFYSASEKRMIDSEKMDDFQTFSIILLIGIVVSGITYSIIAYIKLNKYAILIDNNFSNNDSINLNWLKSLIWGVGILFLVVATFVISKDLLKIDLAINPDIIIYSCMTLSILLLGYFGIRHQNIFTDNIIVENTSKDSYHKSGLKEDEASMIHQRLLQIMEEEKPYLQPKLSLTNLAYLVNTSPNHLSQIINQFENKNFNDFVNQYRVEEFIHLAIENNQYSYLALALEAGFNSKSTFNKLFKKHKGMTPSQFLAQKRA
jgi:AraC-like DNA-binding protein